MPQRSRPFHLQPVSPSAHQNQAAGKEWPRAVMMFHEFSSLPCDLVAYNAAIAACETGGVGLGMGLCWARVSAHHEEGVLMWYVMVLACPSYGWSDDTCIQRTCKAHWSGWGYDDITGGCLCRSYVGVILGLLSTHGEHISEAKFGVSRVFQGRHNAAISLTIPIGP